MHEALPGWGVDRFNFIVDRTSRSHHAPISETTEADLHAPYIEVSGGMAL
ncbi:hypothetical protein [Burkholderia lata]|nr:hypothetical protein [Burkholderia lata]